MTDLKGKTALVTGSTSEIGRAATMALAAPRRSPSRPRPDAGAVRRSMTIPKPWRARLGRAWPMAKYALAGVPR